MAVVSPSTVGGTPTPYNAADRRPAGFALNFRGVATVRMDVAPVDYMAPFGACCRIVTVLASSYYYLIVNALICKP